MATYEKKVIISGVDESGNKTVMYPVTKLDYVEDADDLLHYGKTQTLTEEQKAIVRANIGADEACRVIYLESTDTANLVSIRDLESGTYIFYGKFKPFASSSSTLTFSSSLLVNVVKRTNDSQVMVFYPVNNCVQYLYITDTEYTRKNIYLNAMSDDVANSVQYVAQTLTDDQKTQARDNIGAISEVDVPVKGVDYWTEADQESIVQQVIAALGTPVFGTVDENNNIILTGNLPEDTYYVKYEAADGNLIDIGTMVPVVVVETEDVVLYWLTGVGINAEAGGINAAAHCALTDFVVIESEAEYMLVQDGSLRPSNKKYVYARCYDANGTYLGTSENLLSDTENSTSISFVDGSAMFRLHCEDNLTTDASLFEPAISLKATKQSEIVAIPYQTIFGIKLDKTTGAESSDTYYAASDFIAVDISAYDYKAFAADTGMALNINCYDASKTQVGYLANIISGGADGQQACVDLELPDGTAYVRLRFYHGSTDENGNAYINKKWDFSLLKYPKTSA